jgi:glycosyltransferase involved in cell wall biosynthesis
MVKNVKKISIIVCAYNEEKFIYECINSILRQKYINFELILIDDGSVDRTSELIHQFKDFRIIYIRNEINKGLTFSKNLGLAKAIGEFIFFIDADCVADKNWLDNTIKYFEDEKISLVEGKILPMQKGYIVRLSDKIPINEYGGKYATGNSAYRTKTLDLVKRKIDLKYDGFEDRELGLRTLKKGGYKFAKDSIVYHQYKKNSIKSYISISRRIPAKVLLIKKYNDRNNVFFNILCPNYFFVIFFPFLIFVPIFRGRVRSLYDLCFIPLIYIKSIYLRYLIWKTSLKERVFII